jgi:hypothetical protein
VPSLRSVAPTQQDGPAAPGSLQHAGDPWHLGIRRQKVGHGTGQVMFGACVMARDRGAGVAEPGGALDLPDDRVSGALVRGHRELPSTLVRDTRAVVAPPEVMPTDAQEIPEHRHRIPP